MSSTYIDPIAKNLFVATQAAEKPSADESRRERLRLMLKAVSKIDSARLADERELAAIKWFDYRFMSPVEATVVFSQDYQKAFKAAWRASRDRDEAEKKIGIASNDVFHSGRELNSFWRCRQVVDELGMPYQFFIAAALEASLRIARRQLPRPNQLYKGSFVARAVEKWNEWQADGTITYSKLPQYREESFRASPHQLMHRDWVVSAVRKRKHPAYSLSTLVFQERVLSQERAVQEFGPDVVAKAKAYAEGYTPVPHEMLSDYDLHPSCFAVPHAFNGASPSCSSCAVADLCKLQGRNIMDSIERKFGSVDPVLARKREQGSERQRRFRAKNKAGAEERVTHSPERASLVVQQM
ncbi:hypothetical protein SAMN05444161_4738 [Rhizobiales bacterium GAS191]|nr:hypothetical protein SAMN05444161_4738 [Rhizobiales bacterium GAS191]